MSSYNNNNNDQSKKIVDSRCAELFANYCDMLLRKTNLSRHLTSEQIESKLKNVVSLAFAYGNQVIIITAFPADTTVEVPAR